jgi:hypothetical protein
MLYYFDLADQLADDDAAVLQELMTVAESVLTEEQSWD